MTLGSSRSGWTMGESFFFFPPMCVLVIANFTTATKHRRVSTAATDEREQHTRVKSMKKKTVLENE